MTTLRVEGPELVAGGKQAINQRAVKHDIGLRPER